MPARRPLLVLLLASSLTGGCDGESALDAGIDAGGVLDGGSPSDSGGQDSAAIVPDGATAPCETHHDCEQGSFCHRGECRRGEVAIYHCGKPGCAPGHWCVEADGTRSVCPENDTYACESACDCGPAHCCVDNRCIRDDGDPRSGTAGAASLCPVGPDVPAADRSATYCATDPACHAASLAWRLSGRRGTFLAYDPVIGESTRSCGGDACFGTACNCDPGQSCVDTLEDTATGTTCGLFTGGTCTSNAIAESVFGVAAAELLGCCADGCVAGERCDAGWMRRGNRRAYERVVAECPPADGCECGDGECCPEELRACPSDCMPERCTEGACEPISCGDGRCDPFEDDRRCPTDCPAGCGDGLCGATESTATCFTDCQEECGDGWCSVAELTAVGSCLEDCEGRCADADLYSRVYRVCGDGVCDRTSTCDYQDPETCASCPQDCGACDWEIVEVAPDRPVRGTLNSVWVNAADDVFVVSWEGHVYRFDGAGWHLAAQVTSRGLAVWSPGPGLALAVGSQASFRYDGRAWGTILAPRDLQDVWGTALDDVFAVSREAIHHYDGRGWTGWPRPELGGRYPDLFGTSSTSLWVAEGRAEVMHFDGGTWTEHPTVSTERVSAIWAGAPDAVYGVGGTVDRVGGPLRASVVHFDGGSWSDVSPAGAPRMVGVWGAAPDDVFAVDETGDLWRYDGASWTSYAATAPFEPSDLHGSAADNVYGVGVDVNGRAAIHRFDGTSWAEVPVTSQNESFSDVWGTSGADLRLVANDRVYALDGDDLSHTSLAPSAGTTRLLSVWGASGELFASGVYTLSEPGRPLLQGGLLWHRQGDAWTEVPLGAFGAVGGSGPGDVFVVGARDPDHFDGTGWTSIPLTPRPSGVWASGPGDIFMVGRDAIHHCTTSPCDEAGAFATTAVSGWLRSISGTGPTDVFAAGDDGVVFHFDGTTWTELRRGGPRFEDIAVRGPADAYVVAEQGLILHYDGSTWAPAQADLRRPGVSTCPGLTAITNAGGELVVVGWEDLIVRQHP